jgi:hypothetical protein
MQKATMTEAQANEQKAKQAKYRSMKKATMTEAEALEEKAKRSEYRSMKKAALTEAEALEEKAKRALYNAEYRQRKKGEAIAETAQTEIERKAKRAQYNAEYMSRKKAEASRRRQERPLSGGPEVGNRIRNEKTKKERRKRQRRRRRVWSGAGNRREHPRTESSGGTRQNGKQSSMRNLPESGPTRHRTRKLPVY